MPPRFLLMLGVALFRICPGTAAAENAPRASAGYSGCRSYWAWWAFGMLVACVVIWRGGMRSLAGRLHYTLLTGAGLVAAANLLLTDW